jgi:hypothetical protein
MQHPSYDMTTQKNDIAIFFLSNGINLNNHIQLACLPSSNSTIVPSLSISNSTSSNETVFITPGWSRANRTTLDSVELKLINGSFCDSSLMICAGFLKIF